MISQPLLSLVKWKATKRRHLNRQLMSRKSIMLTATAAVSHKNVLLNDTCVFQERKVHRVAFGQCRRFLNTCNHDRRCRRKANKQFFCRPGLAPFHPLVLMVVLFFITGPCRYAKCHVRLVQQYRRYSRRPLWTTGPSIDSSQGWSLLFCAMGLEVR